MKNLTETAILITMSKGDRENIETEAKKGVLDKHFGGKIHLDIRCGGKKHHK
jgi:hypothetical protein